VESDELFYDVRGKGRRESDRNRGRKKIKELEGHT
jgi:hypothetical protein